MRVRFSPPAPNKNTRFTEYFYLVLISSVELGTPQERVREAKPWLQRK